MKNTLETRIATLLADPLCAARAAADAGHRVIAYVGPDVPVELILAAGAVPVRLSGKAGIATPQADDFVERAFVPEIRSIAEQWVSGALDFIDSIVLPRSDDSAQRLYYYMCELQRRGACRRPRPLILDIAAVDRQSSAQHTIAATLKLARELGRESASLAARDQRKSPSTLSVLQRIATKQLATVAAPRERGSPTRAMFSLLLERAVSSGRASLSPRTHRSARREARAPRRQCGSGRSTASSHRERRRISRARDHRGELVCGRSDGGRCD